EEKLEYFRRLKSVLDELKSLEDVLASPDRPELLASVSDPESIRTRVKSYNGRAWLIAANVTGKALSATFTWNTQFAEVKVIEGSRSLIPVGVTFSDNFAPYEAHVYEVL
ncbi:MAG: hypothetical protein ACPL7K_03830, partial [Armatimonadota bacterium]